MLIDSYTRWWRTTDRSMATVEIYGYTISRLGERLGGDAGLLTVERRYSPYPSNTSMPR